MVFTFQSKKSISKKNDIVTWFLYDFLLSKVRKVFPKNGSVIWFLLSKVRKIFSKNICENKYKKKKKIHLLINV